MAAAILAKRRQLELESVDLDSERTASWLHSPYSGRVWTVSDTYDVGRTVDIDFRYRLADGSCLTDSPRLRATVAEFAYWVRDPQYSDIDDAKVHRGLVLGLMTLAHALTLRGIWSFDQISPYDIQQLSEAAQYGSDRLLDASNRVKHYLQQQAERAAPLPQYVSAAGRREQRIHTQAILRACHLPESASLLPSVAWHVHKAGVAAGYPSKSKVSRLAEVPPEQPLTASSVFRLLWPLESLYEMRNHIAASSIRIRPFPQGAAVLSRQLGADVEHTPTVPPRLALYLLEHSARWVVNYGPQLLAALDVVRALPGNYKQRLDQLLTVGQGLPQQGPLGSPWPLHMRATASASNRPLSTLTFQEAIKFLVVACFIIIATFTARRREEILSLEADCLRGSDSDGWWLHVYIEKTLQRREWIPVPSVVARAVEVMLKLSLEARVHPDRKSDSIFQWLRPFGPDPRLHVVAFDPCSELDAFAKHVRVPLARSGEGIESEWHFHPHQFRKFFSVLYYYRFTGADIEVLSHHLRHFNLNMTRVYITKHADVAAMWTDVEWGFSGDLARSIASGQRVVSGGMGAHLTKLARRITHRLRARLQVVSPDRVGAALEMVIRRKGLVLTPKPWVVCSCPRTRSAAEHAACRTGSTQGEGVVGPDFSQAGPLVCPSCPHSIQDGSQRSLLDAQVRHLELVASSDVRAGTIFGELERAHLLQLREARRRA